ncbi:MAG: TlpA family protein disulfide reductase [Calditrichaeota bacterium]|nr:MAG: TlpA family protein disulfide reductase [Calditrichota bacterium]
MKKRGWLLTVLITMSVGMGIGCSKKEKSVETSKPKVDSAYNQRYNFSVKTVDGKNISLEDFKGKVVIVDMWDTWCPPCRMEIPHFIELQRQYQSKGFEMIGIAFGRYGLQAVQQFVVDNNINYVNAIATDDVMSRFGEIDGIPTTFVIDQNGNIYKKYIGYNGKTVFENDIKKLLNL